MQDRVNEEKKEETPAPLVVAAKSRLMVVGIGNCGVNALREMSTKCDPILNPFLGLMAVEPNRPMLDSCFEVLAGKAQGHLGKWMETEQKKRIHQIQLGDSGLGAGGDPEVGRKLAIERLPVFEETVADYDHLLYVGGASGGSVGAMSVFAEAARSAGKTGYALLASPRINEGAKKAKTSDAMFKLMLELCPVLGVQNEHIPDKSLTFRQVFEEINKNSIFQILWLLQSMLQARGNIIDLDGNDWRRGTSIGNFTMAGYYDASEGFDNLKKGLLGNPYLDARNLWNATWVGSWCRGSWSVEDCDLVDECIREGMKNGGQDANVEFKRGIQDEGVAEGVKDFGFVSFAPEGPKEEKRRVQVSIPHELNAPAEPVKVQELVYDGEMNGFPVLPTAGQNGDGIPLEPSALAVPAEALPVQDGAVSSGGANGFHAPTAQGDNNGGSGGDSNTNGLPPATAQDENGGGAITVVKVKFDGMIGGEKVPSEASQELVDRYNNLFARKAWSRLEAQAVQDALKDETGKIFDVPSMPNLGGGRR